MMEDLLASIGTLNPNSELELRFGTKSDGGFNSSVDRHTFFQLKTKLDKNLSQQVSNSIVYSTRDNVRIITPNKICK